MDEIIVKSVDNEILEEEEEAMGYVSKEVSEAVKIKLIELEMQRETENKKRLSREKHKKMKSKYEKRNASTRERK